MSKPLALVQPVTPFQIEEIERLRLEVLDERVARLQAQGAILATQLNEARRSLAEATEQHKKILDELTAKYTEDGRWALAGPLDLKTGVGQRKLIKADAPAEA